MDSTGKITEVWDAAQLMGKNVSFRGLPEGGENSTPNGNGAPSSPRRFSKRASVKKVETGIDKLMLWGQPGHLTQEEVDVYFKFKAEVETRDKDFKDTIYSFGAVEGEVFAYCRWLRARKFNLEDTVKMVEEATVCRNEAKLAGFYPDPSAALGCETSHYLSQYPQLYSGFAKSGAPLFISKPGVLNTDAVECVTTVQNIVKFHWHAMMHDFGGRLRAYKAKNPNFKRFECVCVMDLEHLTMGHLSQKTLSIVKDQSAIDSLCFPETLAKMYIVNGPRFFSTTWKLIKGWLDPRTASKVEVISGRDKWEEKLRDIIDVSELPEDYGGKAPASIKTIENENYSGKLKRVHTEVMYLRGHSSVSHQISSDEEVEITIYTRSKSGAKFTVSDAANKNQAPWVTDFEFMHTGGDGVQDLPSHTSITKEKIPGPATIKVKGDSKSGRFSSSNFTTIFSVYRK
eukprot:scaffold184_cov125-Cylindrotheca_fusiformis.AAC.17